MADQTWDMTAEEQIRKIPRFLAGTAGREGEDTGGEVVRGEDRQFYDPDSNSLVHTTTRDKGYTPSAWHSRTFMSKPAFCILVSCH